MTHKHDWRMMPCDWNMCIQAICMNCSEELDQDEIERRLNATSCLSAEDCLSIYNDISSKWQDNGRPLLDYARALEE